MSNLIMNPIAAKILNFIRNSYLNKNISFKEFHLSETNLIESFRSETRKNVNYLFKNADRFQDYRDEAIRLFMPEKSDNYKKISDRASEFLDNLGTPDDSIIDEYLDYVKTLDKSKADVIDTPSTTYYVVYRENGILVKFFCPYVNELNACLITLDKFKSYVKEVKQVAGKLACLNPMILLVNLWISENKTSILINSKEPTESLKEAKSECEKANAIVKPFAYRYIHITDNDWNRYENAIRAVKNSDANYKVPSWLVRAHFRKINEKYILIKAHFAHRRCKEVQETELIDLYV